MPWKLTITRRATKDLDGLPRRDREAMELAIGRLAEDPGTVDFAKLAGRQNEWRLRVGAWRAIVELDAATGTLTVRRVLPRGRAYRD
jgi:mRNA-degrading endonuclease RelE of RelBE toxin-antitoxin system